MPRCCTGPICLRSIVLSSLKGTKEQAQRQPSAKCLPAYPSRRFKAAETNGLVAPANQEKEISQLAKGLPKPSNTVISSRDEMTKRPKVWQAHLSKISDFLKPGPEVWWKWREDGSVEFFDAPGEPNSREQVPQLNHFRSRNISTICKNLEETWE